ncbi:MAG: type II toxin-antitoxin system RelE/ParE family toxin [Bauldia sp.]
MKRRSVVFAPEAANDLLRLYEWIADAAGPSIAIEYIDQLEAYCLGFDLASECGILRDDIRPGLRIVGFKRRMTIAFTVDEKIVTVLRVFYGGQDWESTLG